MIESLVGYRLIELNNNGFKVEKDGDIKTFEFEEDYGDCCGFNEIETNLLISDEEFSNNPVITEVEYANPSRISYYDYKDQLRITFMGESKPIAEINSLSSSGSGYGYGAHVWVVCKETNETEELTSW